MRPIRLVGIVVLLTSLALGVFGVARMARRVAAYNERSHFEHYRFDIGSSREFTAHGLPVKITDADDTPGDGRSELVISYDAKETRVPVVPPPVKDVPDLGVYGDWAKVIEVHQVVRGPDNSLMDKDGTGRILVICRIPPEGYDPQTWGSVRRADWTFDFHEFKPDGTLEKSTFRWPRSELGEMSLKKEIDKGDETAKVLATLQPLDERSWQYQAALHVIPKLNVPKYRFQDTAMKAMGWTLPVAMFSGLGVIAGIAMIVIGGGVKSPGATTRLP